MLRGSTSATWFLLPTVAQGAGHTSPALDGVAEGPQGSWSSLTLQSHLVTSAQRTD